MTMHTLAMLIVWTMLMQLGLVIGYPKDTRPWTPARQIGLAVGLVQLTFLIWLLVEIL